MRIHYSRTIIFLLILLTIQTVPLASQGTWDRITSPTSQSLRSICFSDTLNGWVAGDSGTIIHTADGGKTWDFEQSNTLDQIVDVFFLDKNRGWASALNYSVQPYGTTILKTVNGGNTWIPEPFQQEDIFISCILYLDSLNGWMGGRPHALLKTTDGGIHWKEASIDTSTLAFFPVLSINFFDKKYGYACGGLFDIAGVIWRTKNGGDNWEAIDPSFAPADEIHKLYLFDSLHVLGAGGDPDFGNGVGMITSLDGGINWSYNELKMQGTAYDLDFRTDKDAWAPLGIQNKLIWSKDSGNSWTPISTPDSLPIFKITFPDSLHGFGIGNNGTMIRYKPVINGISELENNPAHHFTIGQNYPNPFSTFTTIDYSVPAGRVSGDYNGEVQVKLAVYDIMGREVAVIVDELLAPGRYKVSVDKGQIPPGIHFYRLLINENGSLIPVTNPKPMITTD